MAAKMTEFDWDDLRNTLMESVKGEDSDKDSLAIITKRDKDGTIWAHLIGSDMDTPTDSTAVTVKSGDLVRCRVENGRCHILDNVTSTGVNVALLSTVVSAMATGNTESLKAFSGNFEDLKALTATVNTLNSVMATIGYLQANYIDAKAIRADYLDADTVRTSFLNVDFGNFNALQANMEAIRDLFAKTGLFEQVRVLGDGTITGLLNATLLNGDTARFSNIYADAIKILGEDGLYHALNLVGMSEADAQVLIDKYGEYLDGGLHGSHILAESITADKIDVTSLMAAMLMSQFVQIGASGGIHIESVGNRMSFLIGGATIQDQFTYTAVTNPTGSPINQGWYEVVDGRYVRTTDQVVDPDKTYYVLENTLDPYTSLPGEVAYIAIDPDTGESIFYMTHTVVLKTMRFGKWMWFERENSNMALKWIGVY